MESFAGKTAVITGASSGIGREIAIRCAEEGMQVVLAGTNMERLQQTAQMLGGAEHLCVTIDVSKREGIQQLADAALSAFGKVDLLFNNAGIALGKLLTESTIDEWKRVLDTNLWSVIHAIDIFLPIMERQKTPCRIVNTASQAGFETGTDNALYRASKHAVVCLSESLYYDTRIKKSNVSVSVFCPAFVRTNIAGSMKTGNETTDRFIAAVQDGMDPKLAVDILFRGLHNGQFYIMTHDSFAQNVQQRADDVIAQRDPTPKLLLRKLGLLDS